MRTSAVAAEQRTRRLESLTSLRFIAAFVVFMYHGAMMLAGQPLDWVTGQGSVGVSFFFVLSGFVLTWSRNPTTRPRTFLRRRFARIYPAYVAAIGLYVLTAWKPFHRDISWGLNMAMPAVLLQAWVPSSRIYFGGVAVSWSLSCEMFFYATFPFVIGPIVRLSEKARTRLAVVMIAIPFATGLARLASDYNETWKWVSYYFPPVRLAEFVLGILLALAVEGGTWPKISLQTAATIAAAAYLAAGFAPEAFRDVAITLVPVCVLIGAVATSELNGTASRLLRQPWLIRLGIWSYAFYLVHLLMTGAVVVLLQRRLGRTTAVTVLGLGLGFVATTMCAAFLHRFVEAPMERLLRGKAR
jgi:peptidoglycan/LPS O-acetylase OafA/YrhL